MERLCIVIKEAPYGSLRAAEGIRHLTGGREAGMMVNAVLVDDGVYAAKRGQNPGETGWVSLSTALEQALDPVHTATARAVHVYVHQPSARGRALSAHDLVQGVELIDDDRLADIIAEADGLLIF